MSLDTVVDPCILISTGHFWPWVAMLEWVMKKQRRTLKGSSCLKRMAQKIFLALYTNFFDYL